MIEGYVYWLQWALIGWMGALIVLVLLSFARGKISARGMLQSPQSNTFDPERLALLFATIGIALYYVVNTIGTDLDDLTKLVDGNKTIAMPDIPVETLYLLFGAQSSYVTGKIFRMTKGVKL